MMAALVCVAVHETFTSKNTCVTADVKQRIRLSFVLNIADMNQLENALIGPDTESLRSDRGISTVCLSPQGKKHLFDLRIIMPSIEFN